MLDIIVIILFVILFMGSRKTERNDQYLSVSTSGSVRGFFSIAVILHHLAQRTGSGVLFRVFNNVGYLAVAIFFFYSGYGLQKSYMNKGEAYKEGFLKRRLPGIVLPYIIMIPVYWVMYALTTEVYSLPAVLYTYAIGEPIVLFSWYIINITVFYAVYHVLMGVCGKNYDAMVRYGMLWHLLYLILCMKLGFGFWWYQTSHVLMFGMYWAIHEQEILKTLQKKGMGILVWTGFLIAFVLGIFAPWLLHSYAAMVVLNMIAALLFVTGWMKLNRRIQFGNPILQFLGKISLETYLVQGLFITALRSNVLYIRNEFVWCSLVLVCSVACAYLFHLVFKE